MVFIACNYWRLQSEINVATRYMFVKHLMLFKIMKRFVWLIIFIISLFHSTNILNAQNYTQLSKLIATDRSAGNQFGNAVSISGNYAVVGAANIAQAQIVNPGNCAYVFERKADGTWMQIQKLTPHDP